MICCQMVVIHQACLPTLYACVRLDDQDLRQSWGPVSKGTDSIMTMCQYHPNAQLHHLLPNGVLLYCFLLSRHSRDICELEMRLEVKPSPHKQ